MALKRHRSGQPDGKDTDFQLTFIAMIAISPAVKYYIQKDATISTDLEAAKKRRNLLAWLRGGTILITLFFLFMAINRQELIWLLPMVLTLAAFGRAVILDVNNGARMKRLQGLKKLIGEERAFLEDGKPIPGNEGASPAQQGVPAQQGALGQPGTQSGPVVHPYAYDLDIFGKGSLYAMVNRAQSEPGRDVTAGWLLKPTDRTTIIQRQEAVKELAQKPGFLFDLMAIGQEQRLQFKTLRNIDRWLQDPDIPFKQSYWSFVRWAYPILTLGVLISYIAGLMTGSEFGLCFLGFIVISSAFSSRVGQHYKVLSGMVAEVSSLAESLILIEKQDLKAPLNQQLKKAISEPVKASEQIKALDRLLSRFDYRLNVFVFIPLNAFTLWDLQQMKGLNQWKERNRTGVDQWVYTLANMEALGSLALIYFNKPEWVFPEISEDYFVFEAKELGHPLIPEAKRVCNDFATRGTGQLELITGSNMAGKSTFLRTVGINIVLAMAGGPVCARNCKTAVAAIVSSMRIADNLEDSTSTFYAELKNLRSIIQKVKNGERVFILLDEILRGTNSRDRLAGSKALVKQLIRDKAVGIIATHDLELAQMEEVLPGHIRNYYFDVQFIGDELSFDYRLKNGVCTTKNAELLMKQIGIEM